MQELFVPYELALKLKEIGFGEECLARYCVITEWEKPTGEIRLQISSDCPNNHKTLFKAPLWQQAFEWFEEKHKFNSIIYPPVNKVDYCYEIKNLKENNLEEGEVVNLQSGIIFTKEEARQACLEKLIQILEETK